MRKGIKEAYDLVKFPDVVNDKLKDVKVELTDLDSGERNFTLKLTGNTANFEKAKEMIKDLMKDLHAEYSVVGGEKDSLQYSADKKGNFKLSAGKEITSVVNKILEGADITQALLYMNESDEDEGAYYEIAYNYYKPSIVKVDRPTTDYGALVDILIDNLEAKGDLGSSYLVDIDTAEQDYNEDEYVIGGNHGLALIHNGMLNIFEITPEKAKELNTEEKVDIFEEL